MLFVSTYFQQLVVLVLHHQDVILQLFDLPLTGDLLQLQLLAGIFLLLQMFFQFLHEEYCSFSLLLVFHHIIRVYIAELGNMPSVAPFIYIYIYIAATRNNNL